MAVLTPRSNIVDLNEYRFLKLEVDLTLAFRDLGREKLLWVCGMYAEIQNVERELCANRSALFVSARVERRG